MVIWVGQGQWGALKTLNSFNTLNTFNSLNTLKTFHSLTELNSFSSISLNSDAIFQVPLDPLVIEGISPWPIEEACY